MKTVDFQPTNPGSVDPPQGDRPGHEHGHIHSRSHSHSHCGDSQSLHSLPAPTQPALTPLPATASMMAGMLGWAAWQRLLAVLPLLLLLWLAVAWALPEVPPSSASP